MLLFLFGTTLPLGCSSEFSNCDDARCPADGGGSAGTSGKGGTSGGSGQGGDGPGGEPGGGSSGSSGTSGSAGIGGSLPCDGACGSSKPFCKESSDTCVECLKDGDCDGATPFCDTTKNVCVACLDNEDCESPTASKCEGGQCVGCGDSAECSHISGKTACDTSASECVECTPADEEPCNGKSCNPVSFECTGTNKGSVGTCEPCLADSECAGWGTTDPAARCVPMTFKGLPRVGGFCLKRAAQGCTQPLTVTYSTMSLSGAASESYCGADQATTTCEAVLDMVAGQECSTDPTCGCKRDAEQNCINPGEGGLCKTVGGVANRCTIPCEVGDQCPSVRTCTIDVPYCH
jgi:hypothetical protein